MEPVESIEGIKAGGVKLRALNRVERRRLIAGIAHRDMILLSAVSERGNVSLDELMWMWIHTVEADRPGVRNGYQQILSDIDAGVLEPDRVAA
jgi:hypothetical protein